jgi:hypothetical protein
MMLTIDWRALARDGALFSVVGSLYLMAALRTNPRWFLRHYPREVREVAAPLTDAEKRSGRLVGLPFLAWLAAAPIVATVMFANSHPEASFFSQAVHGFGVFMVFNAVDLLVLDLFWLGLLRPAWVMLPGTEHVPYGFNTWQHVRGFASGTILALIVGLAGAAVAQLA